MSATFEAVTVVTLAESAGLRVEAFAPDSFGFIVTLGSDSYSSAVVAAACGHLLPGKPCQVRLRFLVAEAAAQAIHPGSEFSFFAAGRRGTGYVLSVHYAPKSIAAL